MTVYTEELIDLSLGLPLQKTGPSPKQQDEGDPTELQNGIPVHLVDTHYLDSLHLCCNSNRKAML